MGISAFSGMGFLQLSQKLRGFTNDNPIGSLYVKRFIKLPREIPIKKRLTIVKRFKLSILVLSLDNLSESKDYTFKFCNTDN